MTFKPRSCSHCVKAWASGNRVQFHTYLHNAACNQRTKPVKPLGGSYSHPPYPSHVADVVSMCQSMSNTATCSGRALLLYRLTTATYLGSQRSLIIKIGCNARGLNALVLIICMISRVPHAVRVHVSKRRRTRHKGEVTQRLFVVPSVCQQHPILIRKRPRPFNPPRHACASRVTQSVASCCVAHLA